MITYTKESVVYLPVVLQPDGRLCNIGIDLVTPDGVRLPNEETEGGFWGLLPETALQCVCKLNERGKLEPCRGRLPFARIEQMEVAVVITPEIKRQLLAEPWKEGK